MPDHLSAKPSGRGGEPARLSVVASAPRAQRGADDRRRRLHMSGCNELGLFVRDAGEQLKKVTTLSIRTVAPPR
jgi:hypothetical protein